MPEGDDKVVSSLAIRPVTKADVEIVCAHRRAMFAEAGKFREEDMDAAIPPFRAWLTERLASGDYFGFLAEDLGAVVGGVGMMLLDWPPHPFHPHDARRGYVCNVFVEPSHRRRGLATRLATEAEAELRRRGIAYAVLHASPLGRPIYEQDGWKQTNEMAKFLAD